MMRQADFYKQILDNLSDGIYFVDPQRCITYWNRGAERISGFPAEQVMGSSCADNLLIHVDENGVSLCQCGCPLQETLQDGKYREAQVFLHHAEGHRVPVIIRVSPIQDEEGEIIGAVETFSDNSRLITTLRRVSDLQRAALFDDVTGIGNRRFTELHIKTSLEELRTFQTPFGVLFFDVDHFKRVNDTYGHTTGDRVLRMVAKTASQNLRSSDVIGRWGGDEFLTIISNVDQSQLERVANKLRVLIEQSQLETPAGTIRVTISGGCSLARDKDSLKGLVKRVDDLFYKSKKSGNNHILFD
jgi:diguanylate cyclase (GGDEF)-like protein/PAS domain S-box-containing protein